MTELTPEIFEKWLNELRGGNYLQGRGRLRQQGKKEYSFCCLGVLADIINPHWEHTSLWADTACVTGLPPNIVPHEIQGRLIGMNDNEEKSFREIADYLEDMREELV
jgi:hypothetical protein